PLRPRVLTGRLGGGVGRYSFVDKHTDLNATIQRAATARVVACHGTRGTVAEGLDQPARRQAVFSHKIIDDRIGSTLTQRAITSRLARRIRVACYRNHPAF